MFGQKTSAEHVPPAVVTTFQTAYPKAEKIQWELDEEDYMAGFVLSKTEKSAHYSADGKWLRTETLIRVLDVPKPVKRAASKNFRGYTIIEPVKVETEKGTYYKMELTKDDLTYEVEIKENGEITKHKEKEDPNKKEEEKKKEE
jgi:hypothetical protein